MNKLEGNLVNLIKDYIACSKYMCTTLKESFNTKGESILRARRINLIPKEGILPEGFYFNFHGGGCYFEFDNGNIDVDFGPDDRCDGFDNQRLYGFWKSSKKERPYLLSEIDIKETLGQLLSKGTIIKPGWLPNPHLFYLAE